MDKLDQFRQHLVREQLSATAVSHYVAAVKKGLDTNDILYAIRSAKSASGAKLARAGLLRWAAWTKDRRLKNRIPLVPYVPPKPREQRLTPTVRARLERAIAKLPPRQRPVFQLAFRSHLRIGQILALTHETLADVPMESSVRAALEKQADWETLADLLTTGDLVSAYVMFRRTIVRLCEQLGIEGIQPGDFRRLALAQLR